MAGRRGRAARSDRRAARPWPAARLRAGRRARASAFPCRLGRHAAMRWQGDEARPHDGCNLRRHPVAPGTPRLDTASRTREPAVMAEALARPALWSRLKFRVCAVRNKVSKNNTDYTEKQVKPRIAHGCELCASRKKSDHIARSA